jgi:pimeloyl-ACP methyl ester carboxylesterase
MLDGTSLVSQQFGEENSKKILLMHGWLDNSNSFSTLAPVLASSGYHVIALDNAGHGKSDHLLPCGNYTMIKSVAYVVEVIEQLGWSTFSIVGHSMGAAIALMYTSVYPERIVDMVLIEGLGPMSLPASATVKNLKKAIEAERKSAAKSAPTKLYPSLADAVNARVASVAAFPGNQTLSREAAQSLVSRVAYLVDINSDNASSASIRLAPDVIEETAGPVRFRHDPRLALPSFHYHTSDQVMSYINGIQSRTLLITGDRGWPLNEEFEQRKAVLVSKGILTHRVLPGSHHLHLDPDTATLTATTIAEFLQNA